MKWLEAAGAQVVPVIISIDDNEDLTEYFQEVLNNLPSNMFLNLNIFSAHGLFFLLSFFRCLPGLFLVIFEKNDLLGVFRGEWVADTRRCNFHLPFRLR